jgi:hypothetical protein
LPFVYHDLAKKLARSNLRANTQRAKRNGPVKVAQHNPKPSPQSFSFFLSHLFGQQQNKPATLSENHTLKGYKMEKKKERKCSLSRLTI